MIRSMVRMALPAAQLSEVIGILAPMAQRTRAERGCLDCQLHRDALEQNVVILEEKWASEADLERHLRSQDYRELLLVMELATGPPEVTFDSVSQSSGLEKIEKARS